MVCFRGNQLCVSVYQVVGVAVGASTACIHIKYWTWLALQMSMCVKF